MLWSIRNKAEKQEVEVNGAEWAGGWGQRLMGPERYQWKRQQWNSTGPQRPQGEFEMYFE